MRIRKLVQSFNRYLFYLASVPLLIITILTLIDVIGRYFRFPLPGTLEINQLGLAAIVTFAWAHTQAIKGHILIDTFLNLMPSLAQTITKLVMSIIALVITSLIAWQSIPFILLSRRMTEWTDILKLPAWPFKVLLFIGAFSLCLQLILDIIDYSRELRSKRGD